MYALYKTSFCLHVVHYQVYLNYQSVDSRDCWATLADQEYCYQPSEPLELSLEYDPNTPDQGYGNTKILLCDAGVRLSPLSVFFGSLVLCRTRVSLNKNSFCDTTGYKKGVWCHVFIIMCLPLTNDFPFPVFIYLGKNIYNHCIWRIIISCWLLICFLLFYVSCTLHVIDFARY